MRMPAWDAVVFAMIWTATQFIWHIISPDANDVDIWSGGMTMLVVLAFTTWWGDSREPNRRTKDAS